MITGARAANGRLAAALREAFPERALLETDDGDFDVRRYASYGHCVVDWNEDLHCERVTRWQRSESHLRTEGKNAWVRVRWEGHGIDVIRAEWLLDGPLAGRSTRRAHRAHPP